jgi:hypothetical protein
MLTSAESIASTGHQHPPVSALGTSSQGYDPDVLADIYQHHVNLAVWQRSLASNLRAQTAALVAADHHLKASTTVSPDRARSGISTALKIPRHSPLCEDAAELVDMFCCLFDQKRVGFRAAVLDSAMCPRFHVDNVSCRLLTTYIGSATEWLSNDGVDRSKLGRGSQGKKDHESGLYSQKEAIQRLGAGDVALLKGEGWIGNEGRGLVHRSPAVPAGEQRLVMTIDVI